MDNYELGKRLHQLRIARGLTLRDAAEQINISAATLSRLERGDRQPDFGTLRRVAEFVDVSLDVIEVAGR